MEEKKGADAGDELVEELDSAAEIGKKNRAAAQLLFDSLTVPTNPFLAGFHTAKPRVALNSATSIALACLMIQA
jgi:hypothetical protein